MKDLDPVRRASAFTQSFAGAEVTRRNLLSAFMASESGTTGTPVGSEEPTEDVQDDAKIPQ